jgi:N-acetylglucosaminyldiphosphoundecaprenol N-acetyl-beta-D-mannosaminyltransferase
MNLTSEKQKTLPQLITQPLFGQEITLSGLDDCIAFCKESLNNNQSVHVVTLNPEMLTFAKQTSSYAEILKQAQVRLPDGIGLVWALKRKGIKAKRIPGIEFSERLLKLAQTENWSVALIGGTPEVNERLVQQLNQTFPKLQIGLAQHGYFKDAQPVFEQAIENKCRLVLLAVGFPKQEELIAQYRNQFNPSAIFVGVGGSFDVWSGTKKRAPKLFRLLNLEWFYRIASEPWRIQRVMKTLPQFFLKAVILNHNEL